eukprot:TRINITY_DN6834_c0_g1_i1.p1 TRINITY_DN6834_c0_g1~~TRINITY_DN6834_c0_g1_i1.p1  ORF type:complete len:270 (-),score=31.96 TRINITY_DN6834_c0_g1_i1:27-836(-)
MMIALKSFPCRLLRHRPSGFIHSVLRTSITSSPKQSTSIEKEDRICTVPNLLCASRIVASPFIGYLILQKEYSLALAAFGYAGFTDLADGWIARNFKGQASSLGSFLDPLADKILVTSLYFSLSYAGLIPSALTALIVSRDLLLIYAGLYIRYMAVIPPFTIQKYLDVRTPIAQIKPPLVSKVNTLVQLSLVGAALASPALGLSNPLALQGLMGLTAATTLASSVSYAFGRDTYAFTNRSYDHQAGKKLTAFLAFIGFNLAFCYLYPPL